MKKLIVIAIIFFTAAPSFAELSKDEEVILMQIVEFCYFDVPGQKTKDTETVRRILFADETERRVIIKDFINTVLLPGKQQEINNSNQIRLKSEQELQKWQNMVK